MSSTPNRVAKRPTGTPSLTPSRRTPLRQPPQRSTPLRQLQLNLPSIQSPKPAKATVMNAQGEEGIQVAIRMRPLNDHEQAHSRAWRVLPKYSSITQSTADGQPLPERVTGRTFFTFDKAFGEDTTTRQVYESSALNIVKSVCTGLNGTIFAYGQTSSGKTFTMQGSGTIQEGSAAAAGVIHMAAQDIFAHIASNPDRLYLVHASFLEIYNEEVRDLLSSDNKSLPIREDPRRGVFVQCKEEVVTDWQSLLEVLAQGEKSRAFASTAMNERSSRSHTIFRITIESRKKPNTNEDEEGEDGAVLVSTLNLVDLAGSESVRHTGATGDRQKEGGMINTSLLTLSRVMVALGTPNATHVNFRDSKLTRILQPSLSGNARMAIICCATPSELYLEETRSTLQFASRAKLVKTRAKVNEVLDDRSIIRRLQKDLADARRQLGNSGADSVRVLEQQVASSSREVITYKEKLRHLNSCILNSSSGLFGEKNEAVVNLPPRKRRFSDGGLRFGNDALVATFNVPLTIPRPSKRSKVAPAAPLTPSKHLMIVQNAFNSKSQALKQSINASTEAEAKLNSVLAENEKLRSQLLASEGEAVALHTERDSLRNDLSKAIGEQHALQAKLDAEAEARRVLNEALQKLTNDNGAVELDNDRLKLALVEEKSQLESFKVKFEEEKDSFSRLKEQLERKVTSLEEQLRSMSSSCDALHASCVSLDGDKSRLVGQVDQLTEALGDLEGQKKREVEAYEQDIARLTSENSTLTAEVDSLSTANLQYEQEVGTLNEMLSKLTSLSEGLQSTNDDLKEEKTILSSQLDEITSLAKSLESDLEVLKSVHEEASSLHEKEKVNFQEQLDVVLQSKHDLEQSNQSLQDKIISLTSTNERLTHANDSLEQEKLHLSKDVQYFQFQVRTLQSDRSLDLERICSLEDRVEVLTVVERRETTEKEFALSEIQRLTSVIMELQSSLEAAKGELEQSRSDIEGLSRDSTGIIEKLKDLEIRCQALTLERDELSQECQKSKLELNSTQKLVLKLEADCEHLTSLVDEKDKHRAFLESDLQQSKLDYSRTKDCLSNALEDLELARKSCAEANFCISELRESLLNSETELNQRTEDLNQTKARLSTMEDSLHMANEELAKQLASFEKLSDNYAALTSERDTLKNDVQESQLSIKASFKRLEVEEAKYQAVHESLIESKEEISSFQCDLEELTARYESCKTDLETAQTEIESLKQERKLLDDAIGALRAESGTSAEALQKFQSQVTDIDAKLKDSESEKAVLQANLDLATESLKQLSHLNSESERRICALSQELDEARAASASQLAHAEEGNRALRLEAETLSMELSTSLESLRDLETKVSQLEHDRDLALEGWESAKETLGCAQQRIDELMQSHRTITDEVTRLSNDKNLLQAVIGSLESESATMREFVEAKTQCIGELSASVSSLQRELESHQRERNQFLKMEHDFNVQVQQLRSELASNRVENADLTKELLCAHDMLESRSSQLTQAQSSINELEDQLGSLRSILNDKDAKVSEQATQIAQLELAKADRDSVPHAADTIASLDEKNVQLEQECFEMKNLLSDANDKIASMRNLDLDYRSQIDELLEQLREARQQLSRFEATPQPTESKVSEAEWLELKKLVADKNELISDLQNEITRRIKSESELKNRMGEEQRALVKEAESTMQSLYDRLSQVEKEAYATREHNQELRGQNGAILEKVHQLDDQNKLLTRKLDQARAQSDDELERLSQQLKALKKEEHAARQSVLELNKKLRESGDSTVRLAAAMNEIKLLKETNADLRRDVDVTKGAGKENVDAVVALKEMIRQKDERIASLEKKKFTKQQAEQLKQIKNSNVMLEREVIRLRAELDAASMNAGESTDTTKLRFDNQALESKLRKAVSLRQELQEQKELCLDVLRNNQLPVENGDLINAVASLCDRLTSDSKKRGASFADLERLSGENAALQAKVNEQNHKLGALQARLKEIESSKEIANRASNSHELDELRSQIRHLKEENLELHNEKGELKNKNHKLAKEVLVLRSNVNDNVTMELQKLKAKSLPLSTRQVASPEVMSRFEMDRAKEISNPRQGGGSLGSHSRPGSANKSHSTSKPPLRATPSRLSGIQSEARTTPTANGYARTDNDENASNRNSFELDNITRSTAKNSRQAPGLGESRLTQNANDTDVQCQQS